MNVRSVSFEIDTFAVQPPFRLNTIYFAVRTNYTNLNIIPKLKPIHYIFDDREVFVFLQTNDKIPKDITYNFINYKDYLPDYPFIALIIILTFL